MTNAIRHPVLLVFVVLLGADRAVAPDRRADQPDHPDRHLHAVRRRRLHAGQLHRPGAVRRLGVLRLRQLCRRLRHAARRPERDRGADLLRRVLDGAGVRHRTDHPAPPRSVFLVADTGVFPDRVRDRLQMDRRDRRRERPARRASAAVHQRLVVPRLHHRHGLPGHRPAVAHRPLAVRPVVAGTARQRTARAKPGLRHVPPEICFLRDHGRHRRLRRRPAGLHDQGRLRRQSQLAARRRRAADGGAGRRASLPRPALGRHRLHPAGGPAVGDHRKLVADLRADRDPVRARLARGHAGPGLPPEAPHRLDADPQNHSGPPGDDRAVSCRRRQAGSGQADPDGDRA